MPTFRRQRRLAWIPTEIDKNFALAQFHCSGITTARKLTARKSLRRGNSLRGNYYRAEIHCAEITTARKLLPRGNQHYAQITPSPFSIANFDDFSQKKKCL